MRQLVAREEETRAHAFQTALLEQAFYTYAVLLQAIVRNLSRVGRSSRRRLPLLTEYLRCLEHHRELCLRILPPMAELDAPAHLQPVMPARLAYEQPNGDAVASFMKDGAWRPASAPSPPPQTLETLAGDPGPAAAAAAPAAAPMPAPAPTSAPPIRLEVERAESFPRAGASQRVEVHAQAAAPQAAAQQVAAPQPTLNGTDVDDTDAAVAAAASEAEQRASKLLPAQPIVDSHSGGNSPGVPSASAAAASQPARAAACDTPTASSVPAPAAAASPDATPTPAAAAVSTATPDEPPPPPPPAAEPAAEPTPAEPSGSPETATEYKTNYAPSAAPAPAAEPEPPPPPAAPPAPPPLPKVPQLPGGGSPPTFTLLLDPPGATSHFCSEVPPSVFKVRGPNYLDDKVKVTPTKTALTLLGSDLVHNHKNIEHAAAGNAAARLRALSEQHGDDILLINFQLPGRPGAISLMLWFGLTAEARADPKFYPLWLKYFAGDSDQFRKERLKFIPHVEQGNFMMKKAVGSKPAILVKAIKEMRYHRGATPSGGPYLEIDIDINSSSAAVSLWGLVQSVAKGLVMDMGFVLEAQEKEFLPEHLLATVRINKVDLVHLPDLVPPS